jgi:hypothetical protein
MVFPLTEATFSFELEKDTSRPELEVAVKSKGASP